MENLGLGACLVCCECGDRIKFNPHNMCDSCLNIKLNLNDILPRQVELKHCFTCSRYFNPPSSWISSKDRESILKLCLKSVPGLDAFEIIDSDFVYTEPNSKRLKVNIEVKKFVSEAALNCTDTVTIEYVMKSMICINCTRQAAKDYWNCMVQVRQRTDSKTTFMYLEQILIRNKNLVKTLNVKKVQNGVDFWFGNKPNAVTLVNIIERHLPVRVSYSQKLKSHDEQNGTFNNKITYIIELPPINKHDLVVLPKRFAQKLGNMPQLCLVQRVTEVIHLLDPNTLQIQSVNAKTFFENEFKSIATVKNFKKYVVMDIEKRQIKEKPGASRMSKNYCAADAFVVHGEDYSNHINTRTHLGYILDCNDEVLGYDIKNLNCNNELFDELNLDEVPDVILVKKYYNRELRNRNRKFKLDKIPVEDGRTTDDEDRDLFLEDLEEDEDMRKNVNLYKRDNLQACADDDGDEYPDVPIEEMLDLELSDVEME